MKDYINYKNILLLVSVLFFGGCISFTNKPLPSKYHSEKMNYNKSLLVEIEKKKTKIYIDNRFDIDRKDKIIKFIYQYIANKKHDLIETLMKVDKNKNIQGVYRSDVKINTPYSYDIKFKNLIMFNNILINKNQLKIVDDGIVIDNLNSKALIMSLYSKIAYLKNIKGLPLFLKLDTEALENNIAHFTDEYLHKYSLKEPLKKELENQGYLLVNDIKKADIIISTENLGYHKLQTLINEINYPKSYNLTYNDLFKEIDTSRYYKDYVNLLYLSSITPYMGNVQRDKQNIVPNTSSAGLAVVFIALSSTHKKKGLIVQ